MKFAESSVHEIIKLETDLGGVLNQLPVKVLISDFEGKILYANDYLKEQLGLLEKDLVGESVWELNKDPEYGKKIFFERVEGLHDKDVYSYQTEANWVNNTTKWLDIKVKRLNLPDYENVLLWSATDINIVKMMEKDLVKSKARTQAIFESATEGIFTADKNLMIINVNPALQEMFGYQDSELIGEHAFLLIPSLADFKNEVHSQDELEIAIYESFLGKNRQFQGVKKDGTTFPLELNLNEVTLSDESFFTGLIRDISESRELENQILKVAESERFKIGQELHDGVGQMLSAIGLMTRNLSRKLRSNSLPGVQELDEITEMVQEADQEVRQLAHGLAHIELQNEGLQVALKRLCERFQSLLKTNCAFICSPGLDIEDRMMALHLYRIVQEAVKNAIKHGNANKIRVKLQKESNYILLTVEDNGIGLFEDPNEQKFKGMGLSTMRYRAELLGGNFDIGNTSNGWTMVKCLIPYNT
ncbi:PAS domain-containing sensor histidine kinase [Gracilimonas tropica]|uniref:PAS domain-containing sensor histidine kinase n=1 Tax=Gracilimonas tropica TaxID=454600 RepID=UPI0003825429|nr:PAS domain S-box protein [Gracilimonas tropica]